MSFNANEFITLFKSFGLTESIDNIVSNNTNNIIWFIFFIAFAFFFYYIFVALPANFIWSHAK